MGSPDKLEQARYAGIRWNTPLSESHAELLLDRLQVRPGDSVLDLGCGWGELLIRAVAAGADKAGASASGVGVDVAAGLLDRGRGLASERGLARRVRFVEGPAADWTEPADRVLCVGASHAWGGTEDALRALAALIRPGGRMLFAEGFWEEPPTDAALALFGSGILSFEQLVERVRDAGWVVLHMSAADRCEWDDFESSWRRGREEWLLANPADHRAPSTRDELDARLAEYVNVYRGVLGFCYLILARDSPLPRTDRRGSGGLQEQRATRGPHAPQADLRRVRGESVRP